MGDVLKEKKMCRSLLEYFLLEKNAFLHKLRMNGTEALNELLAADQSGYHRGETHVSSTKFQDNIPIEGNNQFS
uniref:Uncharacterized protein n=1 Tax=Globodera rostochiensis TaxID=31243 RepID=A0A914GYW7_GLORO